MNANEVKSTSDTGPASGAARFWWNKVGGGWPEGLSVEHPQIVPLLDNLGLGVAAALDADASSGVNRAFENFREGFRPIWWQWKALGR